MDTFKLVHNAPDFFRCQYHRQLSRAMRSHQTRQVSHIRLQYVAVQEKQGGERLILGGRTHMIHHRQMGQELVDFIRAHLPGMPKLVKMDETTNPAFVVFLGPWRIAAYSHLLPECFQKLRALSGWLQTLGHGPSIPSWGHGYPLCDCRTGFLCLGGIAGMNLLPGA